MSQFTRVVCLAAALCAVAGISDAQKVRATLGARVVDAQGGVVPAATVVVVSDETAVKQQTTTNAQGNWILEFLWPGRYRFSVTSAGFKTLDRSGITLQAGDNKLIDSQLEVGATTQSVDVTAEAPLIDTTSATSGTVITHENITEMPSASHVVTLLAVLSPGVTAVGGTNQLSKPS